MKREFLEALNLDAEAVDKIMAENGKDINAAKSKFADYDDLKAQLEKANAAIEKFGDYDSVKAEVEKYKAEAETARREADEKIRQLEKDAKISAFTSGKRFVNDLTRDSINATLSRLLDEDASKGKSLEDLLKEITDGKENIFAVEDAPTPPVVASMKGGKDADGFDEALARKVMGLPPKS